MWECKPLIIETPKPPIKLFTSSSFFEKKRKLVTSQHQNLTWIRKIEETEKTNRPVRELYGRDARKKRKAGDPSIGYYITQSEPKILNERTTEHQKEKYKKRNDCYWIQWKIGKARAMWQGNPYIDDEMQLNKWSMHNSITHYDRNKVLKNALETRMLRRCELIFLYSTPKSIQEINQLTYLLPHISDDPETGLQYNQDLQSEVRSQRELIVLGKSTWRKHKVTPVVNELRHNNTESTSDILKRVDHWLKIKHLPTDTIRCMFEQASNVDELDMLKEMVVKDHTYRADKLKMCYNRRQRQLDIELNLGKGSSSKGKNPV